MYFNLKPEWQKQNGWIITGREDWTEEFKADLLAHSNRQSMIDDVKQSGQPFTDRFGNNYLVYQGVRFLLPYMTAGGVHVIDGSRDYYPLIRFDKQSGQYEA